MAQPILISRSPLTGLYYAVTRYKVLDNGTVESIAKEDVTEQIEAIVANRISDFVTEDR